jgi:hypothetical protein
VAAKKKVIKRKVRSKSTSAGLSIEKGLGFPWANASRQWYALWLLVPIYGWFALIGYIQKIYREIGLSGKVKGLPEFGSSWTNFTDGLLLFVMLIPLMVVFILLSAIPGIGIILYYLAALFVLPYLAMHLMVTGKFASSFDFSSWWRVVVGNFGAYIIALLKGIIYSVVYGLLSLIIIGIPGNLFGGHLYIADFYARHK